MTASQTFQQVASAVRAATHLAWISPRLVLGRLKGLRGTDERPPVGISAAQRRFLREKARNAPRWIKRKGGAPWL